MFTPVIGLKTHIWNNNIRSFLFLLFYPFVITPLYLTVVFVAFSTFTSKSFKKTPDFDVALYNIMFNYWYVPYAIILIYLATVYYLNINRLDVTDQKEPVTQRNNPELYSLLENLCISRGLMMPYFFIRKHPIPNAYTSGLSEHTFYIAVTSGLLEKLTKEEVEAVLAHELTHIINRDTRLIYLTSLIPNILNQISLFLKPSVHYDYDSSGFLRHRGYGGAGAAKLYILYMIFKLGNIGSLFAHIFLSKKREYMADAGAVELTKNPEAMISALLKIEKEFSPFDSNPIRKPSYIHYFERSSWLSTHPSIEKRVKAIETFSRIDYVSEEERQQIENFEKQIENQKDQQNIW